MSYAVLARNKALADDGHWGAHAGRVHCCSRCSLSQTTSALAQWRNFVVAAHASTPSTVFPARMSCPLTLRLPANETQRSAVAEHFGQTAAQEPIRGVHPRQRQAHPMQHRLSRLLQGAWTKSTRMHVRHNHLTADPHCQPQRLCIPHERNHPVHDGQCQQYDRLRREVRLLAVGCLVWGHQLCQRCCPCSQKVTK